MVNLEGDCIVTKRHSNASTDTRESSMGTVADEFVTISEEVVFKLLSERYGYTEEGFRDGQRARPRWPFPGTVELWLTDPSGEESYLLARALNLSPGGVGILVEEPMDPDRRLRVCIHQPEMTLMGDVVVRHCNAIENGYHCGLQFSYSE